MSAPDVNVNRGETSDSLACGNALGHARFGSHDCILADSQMPRSLGTTRELHAIFKSRRAAESRLRGHVNVVSKNAVMRDLYHGIQVAIIADGRRRNEARRDDRVRAKATAVPDADARKVRHHTAFALVLVKAEAAATDHDACLKNTAFAHDNIRVNRHIRF